MYFLDRDGAFNLENILNFLFDRRGLEVILLSLQRVYLSIYVCIFITDITAHPVQLVYETANYMGTLLSVLPPLLNVTESDMAHNQYSTIKQCAIKSLASSYSLLSSSMI